MSNNYLVFEAASRKPRSQMSALEIKQDDQRIRKGKSWNRQHPVRIKHVVDHWNQATPEEKQQGMDWYADAHHMTKHIANDTGTPMHTMAGLMAAYSPQTPWATNIMTAARVARDKKARGGKGDGVMATAGQKNHAERMLNGEHYDDVLKGRKVHAFAHLIHHGDNADEENPKVVIDRHALSVAAGERAPNSAYEQARLGTKGRYDEISQVYHKAAKKISKQEGRPVKAHQVQAATWLARQRLNEKHDASLLKEATSSRSAKQAQRAIKQWNEYAGEHHPQILGKEPGTGYSRDASEPEDLHHLDQMAEEGKSVSKTAMVALAYGETVAPDDIDTLQDSSCPVCGENDLFSGGRCQVCQYIAPPKQFRDPDLTKARQLDLHKDEVDFDQPVQPGAPGQVPGSVPGQPSPGDTPGQELLDPDQIDEDGDPVGGTLTGNGGGEMSGDDQQGDPLGLNSDQDPQQLLDPDQGIDQDGNPVADDSAEYGEGNPDPNATQPPADGSNGQPGTPGDGVPDLVCLVCGYETDASQPISEDTQDKYAPTPDDGTQAGDVCPVCGQGLLMSPVEMQQQEQMQQPAPAGV